LRTRRIPVYALRTGANFRTAAVGLRVIGPDAVRPDPRDSIGLLRFTMAGHTYLLAGDASFREQTEAAFRPIHLRADTLVLTGDTPLAPDLRDVVKPRRVMRVGVS
jgi:beta-lactamase superfamily II metal-dependent hydrolase